MNLENSMTVRKGYITQQSIRHDSTRQSVPRVSYAVDHTGGRNDFGENGRKDIYDT